MISNRQRSAKHHHTETNIGEDSRRRGGRRIAEVRGRTEEEEEEDESEEEEQQRRTDGEPRKEGKMSDPLSPEAIRERSAIKAAMKREFQKQIHNPHRHGSGEAGHLVSAGPGRWGGAGTGQG